mmetsp:Transcript_92472/g.177550  ORF Transcript_92472/g.177550 Transcript_92472/m.177550 type:complete len:209 (+) Transcript_92472:640-1266(+)
MIIWTRHGVLPEKSERISTPSTPLRLRLGFSGGRRGVFLLQLGRLLQRRLHSLSCLRLWLFRFRRARGARRMNALLVIMQRPFHLPFVLLFTFQLSRRQPRWSQRPALVRGPQMMLWRSWHLLGSCSLLSKIPVALGLLHLDNCGLIAIFVFYFSLFHPIMLDQPKTIYEHRVDFHIQAISNVANHHNDAFIPFYYLIVQDYHQLNNG